MKVVKREKMSASMDLAPVRVKLLFNNLPLESFWVLVKAKKYHKVKDFLSYVKRKFIAQTDGSLSAVINGSKVPEWEKSCIFREDDVVHLHFKDETFITDRLGEPQESENIETKEREVKKKKKKKSKEESDIDFSTDKIHKNVDTPKLPENHLLKKKRKISTDIQETVHQADVESKISSDKEKESVAPKRKRTRKRKQRREETGTPVNVCSQPVNVRPLRQFADQTNNMHIKFSSDNEEEGNSASDSRVQCDFIPQQDTMKYRTSTPDYQAEQNQNSAIESRDFTFIGKSPLTAEKPNMTQSVLANGVTVFSRPRSRQIKNSNFRELSKDEQLSTRLTNRSIVLQNSGQSNGVENRSSTTMDVTDSQHSGNFNIAIPVSRDYQLFPLLQGNPSPGEKIAFKILEMSEDYTPEVGDYKEAEVIGFNSSSQIVELKIIPSFLKERKLGKFDVDFGDEEGESEEFQAHPLISLMEVRLITD